MNDFTQRLQLHNATAELVPRRSTEKRTSTPLAVKIRATKVEIDDVIAFGSATR